MTSSVRSTASSGSTSPTASLDWSGNASHLGRAPTDGYDVLSPDFMRLSQDSYLPDRTRRGAPRAGDLARVRRPRAACRRASSAVGTCDHLFDDSLMFATRAAAAGVDVDLLVLPDMPHAFQMFDCGITRPGPRPAPTGSRRSSPDQPVRG